MIVTGNRFGDINPWVVFGNDSLNSFVFWTKIVNIENTLKPFRL